MAAFRDDVLMSLTLNDPESNRFQVNNNILFIFKVICKLRKLALSNKSITTKILLPNSISVNYVTTV